MPALYRRSPLVLLVTLAALLLASSDQEARADVTVDFESEYSALKVVVPSNLKTFAGQDGIRHSQALFGNPSYGGDKMIAGQLFYVTPGNLTGCNEYQEAVPQDIPKGTHKIFLVDRGSCDFVDKVRAAQKLNAVAVIIADNVCQCSDMLDSTIWGPNSPHGRTPEQKVMCEQLAIKARAEGRLSASDNCERGLPFMADDGTGSDVTIPSFLIDYLDAQPLKDCLESARTGNAVGLLSGAGFKCEKDTKVVLTLEWDLPRSDNKVDWQLWSSSDSEGVFKKAFGTTAKRLQDSTIFTPRYFIWDGEKWGCTINNMCATQCTDGGFYCNPDPDHNLFNGVSGKDVVDENLRQLCVWQQAYDAKNAFIWWDYVAKFASECHPGSVPTSDKFNHVCSEKVQATVSGLDQAKLSRCVTESWLPDKRNKLLQEELSKRTDLRILQLPTAIVNGVILRGGVTHFSILNSICAAFAPDKAPKLCTCVDRVNSDNLLDCINSECAAGEKLCSKDKKCYPLDKYATSCGDICARSTDKFCPSLNQCLPSSQACPTCNDPAKPVYCPILSECMDTMLNCKPAPSSDKGISAFGVFTITFLVVSVAACAAYGFWRRQKARLHDDVRAILSSYMALEEAEDDQNRVSRPSRQVAPSGGNSSSASPPPPVGGQDAATYI